MIEPIQKVGERILEKVIENELDSKINKEKPKTFFQRTIRKIAVIAGTAALTTGITYLIHNSFGTSENNANKEKKYERKYPKGNTYYFDYLGEDGIWYSKEDLKGKAKESRILVHKNDLMRGSHLELTIPDGKEQALTIIVYQFEKNSYEKGQTTRSYFNPMEAADILMAFPYANKEENNDPVDITEEDIRVLADAAAKGAGIKDILKYTK